MQEKVFFAFFLSNVNSKKLIVVFQVLRLKMATSFSPRRSPSARSPGAEVVHMAKELSALSILASTNKGQLRYDTGWDKSPHSFFVSSYRILIISMYRHSLLKMHGNTL